jgi:site-specific recombinase XerD
MDQSELCFKFSDVEVFKQFISFELSLSKNTIDSYMCDISDFLSFTKNCSDQYKIDISTIKNYIENISKKFNKKSTIARKLSSIKSLIRFLIGRYNCNSEILSCFDGDSSLKPQRMIKFIENHKIQNILSKIKDCQNEDLQKYLIFTTLYSTGMRVSELTSLKLSSLNIDRQVCKLQNKVIVRGKGNKERIVLISDKNIDLLSKYIKFVCNENKIINSDNDFQNIISLQKSGFKFVFEGKKRGTSISRQYAWRIVKEVCVENGLNCASSEKIPSPHTLRHSFATNLLNNDVDVVSIKYLLGHSSVATTQIYTSVSSKKIVDLVNECHPFKDIKL